MGRSGDRTSDRVLRSPRRCARPHLQLLRVTTTSDAAVTLPTIFRFACIDISPPELQGR